MNMNKIIYVKDLKSGGYTVYRKGTGGVIAEGKTKKEALQNLINAEYDVKKYIKLMKEAI